MTKFCWAGASQSQPTGGGASDLRSNLHNEFRGETGPLQPRKGDCGSEVCGRTCAGMQTPPHIYVHLTNTKSQIHCPPTPHPYPGSSEQDHGGSRGGKPGAPMVGRGSTQAFHHTPQVTRSYGHLDSSRSSPQGHIQANKIGIPPPPTKGSLRQNA